jgi:hypothetical protein
VSSDAPVGCDAQADEQSTTVTGMTIGTKTCLIMDEVDGMSAGDRGGVGALNVLIKKTKVSLSRLEPDDPYH